MFFVLCFSLNGFDVLEMPRECELPKPLGVAGRDSACMKPDNSAVKFSICLAIQGRRLQVLISSTPMGSTEA